MVRDGLPILVGDAFEPKVRQKRKMLGVSLAPVMMAFGLYLMLSAAV